MDPRRVQSAGSLLFQAQRDVKQWLHNSLPADLAADFLDAHPASGDLHCFPECSLESSHATCLHPPQIVL